MRPTHVSVTEAARRLGISPQAVRLAVKDGRLEHRYEPVYRYRLVIPLPALLAYRPSAVRQKAGYARQSR